MTDGGDASGEGCADERDADERSMGAGGDGGHEHAHRRYLTSKVSVDAHARDRGVLERLLAVLPDAPCVAEAGCGAGLTVPELFAWGVTPSSYLGVDVDAGIVSFARHVVPRILRRNGHDAVSSDIGCWVGERDLRFVPGDALTELPERTSPGSVDLLLAQSFLDLVPLDAFLDVAEAVVAPDGVVYAPLTFDGETVFRPAHHADDNVLAAFHDAIDATPGRDSRAARHVLDRLRDRDAHVEAVSSSDWVVRPVDGTYRADERFFLARILDFVAETVDDDDVDGNEWVATRRRQLANGELTYVARNHDLLFRPQAGTGSDRRGSRQ
jgi:hypothetical protein